jgi:hypothetical protein
MGHNYRLAIKKDKSTVRNNVPKLPQSREEKLQGTMHCVDAQNDIVSVDVIKKGVIEDEERPGVRRLLRTPGMVTSHQLQRAL